MASRHHRTVERGAGRVALHRRPADLDPADPESIRRFLASARENHGALAVMRAYLANEGRRVETMSDADVLRTLERELAAGEVLILEARPLWVSPPVEGDATVVDQID